MSRATTIVLTFAVRLDLKCRCTIQNYLAVLLNCLPSRGARRVRVSAIRLSFNHARKICNGLIIVAQIKVTVSPHVEAINIIRIYLHCACTLSKGALVIRLEKIRFTTNEICQSGLRVQLQYYVAGMDIDPRYAGYECWASGTDGLYSCTGEKNGNRSKEAL